MLRKRCLTDELLLLIAAALIVLSPLSDVAAAGEIDTRFAQRLAQTGTLEFASGLVMLAEQTDLGQVEQECASIGWTSRWRKHQLVVQRAQEVAARTQVDLIRRLEELRLDGQVRSYQPFWVTNMVAVEALPEIFEDLAARSDVGIIYHNAPIELRLGWKDRDAEPSTSSLHHLPDNLICVNVEPAWDLGYRGAGRLVADFDTGADGSHPAFAARWRGLREDVEWWEAWKDPYTNTEFPYDSRSHGTHTLGIMVAEEPDGTPIGVAPEAEWIAAGILIQYNVQKIIECYEWAVDPDGNPGTIDDVPDVINNSWGSSDDCDMTYWNAIDVVEAAGIVNTIAVDNSGPGYGSVNSPESRAASSTVNFGVGNVNPHIEGYPISVSSGRGPSPCDGESIKPEVTAPGTGIYATLPGGNYGLNTGTSMACPHVSGAVAILRQVNPDLAVDEIKTILMETAFDRGEIGEDNDYGWGIIDVGAAVDRALLTLPLFPPRDLRAEVDGNRVILRWLEPELIRTSNPLIAYRIFRAPLGEPFPSEPIASVPPIVSQIRYEDEDLPAGLYHYVVTAQHMSGESGPSNDVPVNVDLPNGVESAFEVGGTGLRVSPNPFHPLTVIQYSVSQTSQTSVTVHDIRGARIKTLVDAPHAPGDQTILWDGTDSQGRSVASGNYFIRFAQGGKISMRRVTLLR